MKNQVGSQFLRKRPKKEIVCTIHYSTKSKLIRLASGAVKRER